MHLVELMASPFVGGPERQVLGLANALPKDVRTTFLSFAERGLARPFLEQARADGFEAIELATNFPRVDRAINEVAHHLTTLKADVLCCNGYKPDLVGWRAARKAGIPVIAVAHGWTGVTWKVRLYEWLDSRVMNYLDAVVCVSEATANRVRKAGVSAERALVIRNALDTTPYDVIDSECRSRVAELFPVQPGPIIGAAGRLSPEKGFDVFVDAAAMVGAKRPDVGFVLFGDGPLRDFLRERISTRKLEKTFLLGGFRSDLPRYLPGLDIVVLSSHTEGLPVAVLEAQAAGVPVVATAVGGTPEVIQEGVTGYLVPPANPEALANRLLELVEQPQRRREMGESGKSRVRREFTFAAQATQYMALFDRLVSRAKRRG